MKAKKKINLVALTKKQKDYVDKKYLHIKQKEFVIQAVLKAYTLKNLCEKTGISRSAIYKFLRERRVLHPQTIEKIKQYLKDKAA